MPTGKFALLYLDKLRPIIPEAGEFHLSYSFRRLLNETDLIEPHRPGYSEGLSATVDALDQVEKILRHPERYEPVFKTRDIPHVWKLRTNQSVELFRGKYSDSWEKFCLSEDLGTRSDHGIYVSSELANIYMTILAQAIADSRAMATITDQPALDSYSMFIRRTDSSRKAVMRAAHSVLDLKLPGNIRDISLDAVIDQRNRRGFREKQLAFRSAFSDFMADAEAGGSSDEFLKSLKTAYGDLTDEVLKIGAGAITFGFGFWLVLHGAVLEPVTAAREIVEGASVAIGSAIGIRNVWRSTKTKRFARRFLADLKQLPVSQHKTD